MIMQKHIKENPMIITKVLYALKKDRTTKKSPARARRSKAEDELEGN
jgi:hypothetical protein